MGEGLRVLDNDSVELVARSRRVQLVDTQNDDNTRISNRPRESGSEVGRAVLLGFDT